METRKSIKIASSGSVEGLTKLINEFFYSTTYIIEEVEKSFIIYNKFGLWANGYVNKKGKKYYFYQYK